MLQTGNVKLRLRKKDRGKDNYGIIIIAIRWAKPKSMKPNIKYAMVPKRKLPVSSSIISSTGSRNISGTAIAITADSKDPSNGGNTLAPTKEIVYRITGMINPHVLYLPVNNRSEFDLQFTAPSDFYGEIIFELNFKVEIYPYRSGTPTFTERLYILLYYP